MTGLINYMNKINGRGREVVADATVAKLKEKYGDKAQELLLMAINEPANYAKYTGKYNIKTSRAALNDLANAENPWELQKKLEERKVQRDTTKDIMRNDSNNARQAAGQIAARQNPAPGYGTGEMLKRPDKDIVLPGFDYGKINEWSNNKLAEMGISHEVIDKETDSMKARKRYQQYAKWALGHEYTGDKKDEERLKNMENNKNGSYAYWYKNVYAIQGNKGISLHNMQKDKSNGR